jgi:hypothetical protein
MAWQGTLRQMKEYGIRVAACCTARGCGLWVNLHIETLIGKFGEDHSLWDQRPECVACRRLGHYMASPGESTPFRPLRSGADYDAARRAFLRGFGFTNRDIAGIRAMAERDAAGRPSAALNDLDVPFRVGCCEPGRESYSTGRPLGSWAGRTLLWWPMNSREEEVWRRRPRGPRKV